MDTKLQLHAFGSIDTDHRHRMLELHSRPPDASATAWPRYLKSPHLGDLNDPGKWERLQQWCANASKLDSSRQNRALFVREED
ncbi:hypothetical protein [Acidicapsa acidisoli]|uniref:hypothetical protein n=1 Tax=Acidicapsa acidisoli TaxID=1615681 RepID=UPI0021DF842B|nr:hypothetical protein [Acidicapsa acidisoli]